MFEWDEEEKHWSFTHHPFTSPKAEHLDILESDPATVMSDAYDLVCNGYELASGSIRIHRRDVQARIFRCLGYADEEIQKRFGHMLDAFEYGAPPHGGMAPGSRPACDASGGRTQHPRSDRISEDRQRQRHHV